MTDNVYISLASHCIGLDYKKPYKRHGRYFYRPYRNYYDAGGKDVEIWDTMVSAGYAEAGRKDRHGGRMYWLTRQDWTGLVRKLGFRFGMRRIEKMNHKVGDEVLVKVRIVEDGVYGYGLKTPDGILFTLKRDSVLPLPDMTAEEAWEIARNISDMGSGKAREIFGTEYIGHIFQGNTAEEAKVKIEAWEAEKEIKVGDEVALKEDSSKDEFKFFVTRLDKKENRIAGFSVFDGDVFWGRDIAKYQKTGRHIDITGLMNQIGGDE